MNYKPDTILTRIEQLDADDDRAPYNNVRVIGPSPVSTSVRAAEWSGQAGEAVSVEPQDGFGPVVDMPQGMLARDYTIVSEPEVAKIQRQIIERVLPGPSPEEQFAAAQSGEKPSRGRRSTAKS